MSMITAVVYSARPEICGEGLVRLERDQVDAESLRATRRALVVPLYQLFYDGENPPALPHLSQRRTAEDILWGSSRKEARLLTQLQRLLGQISEQDRSLLLFMAQKLARQSRGRSQIVSLLSSALSRLLDS